MSSKKTPAARGIFLDINMELNITYQVLFKIDIAISNHEPEASPKCVL